MAEKYKATVKKKKEEAKAIMTDEQVKKCSKIIHTASVASGAGACIPIPVMDAVPISAFQVTMVVSLGKVFNQKINESAAKAIISAAASTLVGRSIVKLIPVAGWGISAAVAAGITEAIGWTTAVDFAKLDRRKTEGKGASDDESIMNDEENSNFDGISTLDDASTMNDSSFSSKENGQEDAPNSEPEHTKTDDESISRDFSKIFGEDEEWSYVKI